MEIPESLRRQIEQATGRNPVSLILDWTPVSSRLSFESSLPRAEKRKARAAAVRTVKDPVVRLLRANSDFKIHDLEGTGHTVVEGPASAWKSLLSNTAFKRSEGRVIENGKVYLIQGATPTETAVAGQHGAPADDRWDALQVAEPAVASRHGRIRATTET